MTDAAGVVTLKPGRELYKAEDFARNLYFVVSGKIEVTRDSGKTGSISSIHSQGDFLGCEALELRQRRYDSLARAAEETVLFLLPRKTIQELAAGNARFKQIFSLLLQSTQLQAKKNLAWKNDRENIVYLARRHKSTLFTSLLPPLIIDFLALIGTLILYGFIIKGEGSLFGWFALVASVCLLWMIWVVFDWYNDCYAVTDQRLLVLEKVLLFYESRQETPLEAIQSLTSASELFGRWLTFGNIQIKTYTGEITFPGIELPELVIDLIEHYSQRAKTRQSKEDRRKIEATIRSRLNVAAASSPPQEETAEDVVDRVEQKPRNLWSTLFSLKEVEGDAITYRTHWFILFRKVLTPTIFCILVIVAVILRFKGMFTDIPMELAALGSALLILLGWGWWIYEFLDWHNDIYVVNSEQVIDINRKPMGHEEKRSAPLKNIQTIEYKRIGVFGLVFNYGTVFIRVGDSELTFDLVSNPSEVQKEIFQHFMQFTLNEKETNIAAENERMADWIQAYHRVTNSPVQGSSPTALNKPNQVK